jgi:uncharacterized membrane protein
MNLEEKLVVVSFILLATSTVFILTKLSVIAFDFPKGDYAGHLARVWFLEKYGYSEIPNWYNGFDFFSHYPPLFYFIADIFYKFIGNLLLSFYFSILFVFLIGFLIFFYFRNFFGKKKEFITLFIILFANPFTTYCIITGRIPEILSWTFFPLVFGISWKIFKQKKLEKVDFIILTLSLLLIILSHIFVLIVSCITILCSFLFSNNKIKIFLVGSVVLSLVLSSFWLIKFLRANPQPMGGISSWGYNVVLYRFVPSLIFILTCLLVFKKMKSEIAFFLPILIVAILFGTYIIDYIPVLNSVFLTTYGIFLIFSSYFILFKSDSKISKLVIVVLNLSFFLINIYGLKSSSGFLLKDHPEYYQMANLSLNLPVGSRFVVLPEFYISREYSVYSFAAVYGNLSTPFGHYPQIAPEKVNKLEIELNSSFVAKNCKKVEDISKELFFNYIITRNDFCKICFNEILRKNSTCVLKVS